MERSSARKLPTCAFCVGGAAATTAEAPDRNALQLHLQDLMLDSVDALEALKLNIQVNSFFFMLSLLQSCHELLHHHVFPCLP